MMRMLPLLLLGFVACQSKPEKLPEPQRTWKTHEEFARFRPVTLAVLKTEAPALEMRTRSRLALSDILIENRRYSSIDLPVIDARTNSDGVFEPGSDLDCDATVKLRITSFRRAEGHSIYLFDAELVMTHDTGVELYRCTIRNGQVKGGIDVDYQDASRQIIAQLIQELPSLPPLPE